MTNSIIASTSKQTIQPKGRSQWMRSTTPILRVYTDEEGLHSTSVVIDNVDSDLEGDDSGLFGSNGSLSALAVFPLPPTTAIKRLQQARSLSNMSTRYHEQLPSRPQIQQQTSSTRQSPLRERRCKKPLTIKAPLPPSRLPIRRTRSSSSMIHSPPPCPPPTTPLPDLPLSSEDDRGMMGETRSFYPEEQTRGSFDADSSGEWMQKTERSTSPSLSSNATTTSSSRSSSQRRCTREPLSSTPPTSDDDVALHLKTSLDWSEQLSLKLGHAFALHLSSAATNLDDSYQSSTYQDTLSYAAPANNEVHIYGFAM